MLKQEQVQHCSRVWWKAVTEGCCLLGVGVNATNAAKINVGVCLESTTPKQCCVS